VVDRWPLVCLGLAGVLRGEGLDVVGQAGKVSEGLLLIRRRTVDLVVFGSPLDGLRPSVVRSLKQEEGAPKVLVLIPPDDAAGVEVGALFVAGADALLVASAGPDQITDAVARVWRNERVVGSELGPERLDRPGGEGPFATRRALPEARSLPLEENRPGPLTAKECEVLALLAQGHSNKQVARALYVSDATVKTHVQHIYAKLGVQNRFGALSRAAELDLLG